MKRMLTLGLLLALAGCGHKQLAYTPEPPPGMDWKRAVSVVEQGFYEDFGPEKAEGVHITPEYIGLSDGTIATREGSALVVPTYGAAVAVGTSTTRTIVDGQRIYFRSMGPIWLYEKRSRDHRYAVIIRTAEGVTARRVFFRSLQSAKGFASAVEYLRRHAEIAALP